MVRISNFIIFIFYVGFAWGHPLPPTPATVNFITGVPLTGMGDTDGGFGDVASNLVMARAYKERHPTTAVNVIITNYPKKIGAQSRTAFEIVKIMIPELSNLKLVMSQYFHGINYILVDLPLELQKAPYPTDTLSDAKLVERIPTADLNIQFAANITPQLHALTVHGGAALSFYEIFGDTEAEDFDHRYYDGPLMPVVPMFSGIFQGGAGIYIEQPVSDSVSDLVIKNWLAKNNLKFAGENSELGFAYSKLSSSAEVYIAAVAILAYENPAKIYNVVTKPLAKSVQIPLPENLHLIEAAEFPDEVVKALIERSTLSPLVTGDVSFSRAIAHASPTKSFVYEAPRWKSKAAASFQKIFTGQSEIDSDFLSGLFILEGIDPNPFRIAQSLSNTRGQAAVHRIIHERLPRWDILDSMALGYDIIRQFQTEFKSGVLSPRFVRFLINERKRHADWPSTLAVLKRYIWTVPDLETRLYAAFAVLQMSESLTYELRQKIAEVISIAANSGAEGPYVGFIEDLAGHLSSKKVQEVFFQALHSHNNKLTEAIKNLVRRLLMMYPALKAQIQNLIDCDILLAS